MMAIMYDPTQDDDKLISDFLAAYYGALAAPWIRLYMVRCRVQHSPDLSTYQAASNWRYLRRDTTHVMRSRFQPAFHALSIEARRRPSLLVKVMVII